MKKADLHVHSMHSARPSEWFLQKIGTRECYTNPFELYKTAKANGMDYVTITDHNQIEGVMKLKEKYPSDVFTGVEVTSYFPEDRCKTHVLVYGLTAEQFEEIERMRNDIYQLRDYLIEQQLAHSVAHATFNINKKLTETHIQKLLLLFDHFEAVNGARSKGANTGFTKLLLSLEPSHIENIYRKHRIEPISADPWKKGLTGGSDDHSGLFIAKAYTSSDGAHDLNSFLQELKMKRSFPGGSSNNFEGFAFQIYKIAHDFSKSKKSVLPTSFLNTVNSILLDNKGIGFKNRIALNKAKRRHKDTKDIKARLINIVDKFEEIKDDPCDVKTSMVYKTLSEMSDELIAKFLSDFSNNLSAGDLAGLIQSISGFLPVFFLSLPYLTTMNVLNESRGLQDKLDQSFGCAKDNKNKRILWFTDSLTDLNGPSETIQKLAWLSCDHGVQLMPVTCLLDPEKELALPPQVINLPLIWQYKSSIFNLYTLRIPSLLGSLKIISELEPDEIIVSTPGPIGLIGILAAKLLHIPSTAIYHTDFAQQGIHVCEDEAVFKIIEGYQRWFHSLFDKVKVPTKEYISILAERGFDPKRMSIFLRGIEKDHFSPKPNAKKLLKENYGVPKHGLTLLYAGRISREKHTDFIGEIYEKLLEKIPHVTLIFAGSGPEPYFSDFKKSMSRYPNVHFPGRLERQQLPDFYSGCDLMVFPSTTDTFGMVILEAQACGLPALVSDVGGPKEIITDGKTGFSLKALDLDSWVDCIINMYHLMYNDPVEYAEMRSLARDIVINKYDWNKVIADIFGIDTGYTEEPQKHQQPSGNQLIKA